MLLNALRQLSANRGRVNMAGIGGSMTIPRSNFSGTIASPSGSNAGIIGMRQALANQNSGAVNTDRLRQMFAQRGQQQSTQQQPLSRRMSGGMINPSQNAIRMALNRGSVNQQQPSNLQRLQIPNSARYLGV